MGTGIKKKTSKTGIVEWETNWHCCKTCESITIDSKLPFKL